MLKIATVCSGIGSPEMALSNLGIDHEISFACEIDKYARQSYLANFETNMILQDMTKEDWVGDEYYADLFVGGIPCQSFSLAGKRLGEADPRGLLFYDFYRYVKNQQPKYFIIENVKGLLSDDSGNTFRKWKDLLGQSENGTPFFFPHEDSLMYNLHWEVLNTKDYGLPQNRERVFLVGIRNDLPNNFNFPKTIPLTKRLKDVLESDVDEKYYLSDKMVKGFISHAERHSEKGNGFKFEPKELDSIANTITTPFGSRGYNNFIEDSKEGYINQNTQASQVYSTDGLSPTLTSGTHGYALGYIKEQQIGVMRGRNPVNPNSRESGLPTEQMLEINKNGVSNSLTSVQKDNLVIEPKIIGYTRDPKGIVTKRHFKNESGTITTASGGGGNTDQFVYEPQTFEIKSATKSGFEIAEIGDSINIEHPNSETRRGRVGKGLAQTLTTSCNQAVIEPQLQQIAQLEGFESEGRIYDANGISRTIKDGGGDGAKTGWYMAQEDDTRIINPLKNKTNYGWHFEQNVFSEDSLVRTLKSTERSGNKPKVIQNYRIRRLTPKECFRLQGYSDEFFEKAQQVNSDTQLYKQAGNTISVPVIQAILKNLLKLETN